MQSIMWIVIDRYFFFKWHTAIMALTSPIKILIMIISKRTPADVKLMHSAVEKRKKKLLSLTDNSSLELEIITFH